MALRVLIVDDTVAFRWWARRLLEAAGIHVVGEAATGAEALTAAAAHRPDVVLLDVQLPDVDGFTVCRDLHESGIEVVLCSVRDVADCADLVAACGACGFLPKERLSAAELLRVLDGGG